MNHVELSIPMNSLRIKNKWILFLFSIKWVTEDEYIPLGAKTVYNSIVDSVRAKNDYGTTKYYTDSDEHLNRIYFKYPPEWRTFNLDEEISIRYITVKWRTDWIKFNIYFKKYDSNVLLKEPNEEIYNKLSLDSIHEIVTDNMLSEYKSILNSNTY